MSGDEITIDLDSPKNAAFKTALIDAVAKRFKTQSAGVVINSEGFAANHGTLNGESNLDLCHFIDRFAERYGKEPAMDRAYQALIRPTDSPADNVTVNGSLGDCLGAIEGWLADKRGRGIAFLFLRPLSGQRIDDHPRGALWAPTETVATFTHPSKWAK